MEKIYLIKTNGAEIPCLVEIPTGARHVVIMIHGFESCKECATGELLFRRMPPEGIGVITYDQPGHGTDLAREEWLGLDACMDSLQTVENYARELAPEAEIEYFASSFGAYVTGLYISHREHLGRKLFMRSGAVNMPWLLLGPPGSEPDPEAIALLKKQGYLQPNIGVGDPVKVPEEMFKELGEHDLFKEFNPDAFTHVDCRMVHGENDPVVDLKFAKSFSGRFDIPITVMPGEGHSINLDPEDPDKVADLAIAFFRE